ncbi:MAG: hypothetical protein NVS3B1_05940 [Marmoricola sp.]
MLPVTVGCRACGARLGLQLPVEITPDLSDETGCTLKVRTSSDPALSTFIAAHRQPFVPDPPRP